MFGIKNLGSVYTDAVSFVAASVSMRLRLSFARHRSSLSSEPGRSENDFKSGVISKRYSFNGRVSERRSRIEAGAVTNETASV